MLFKSSIKVRLAFIAIILEKMFSVLKVKANLRLYKDLLRFIDLY